MCVSDLLSDGPFVILTSKAFIVCWCLVDDMECHDSSYRGQLSLAGGQKLKSHKFPWWNDLKQENTNLALVQLYSSIPSILSHIKQQTNLLMRCHLHTQLSSGLITAIKPSKLLLVQSYTLSLLFFMRRNSSQLSQPSTSNWSNDWNGIDWKTMYKEFYENQMTLKFQLPWLMSTPNKHEDLSNLLESIRKTFWNGEFLLFLLP